MATLILPEVALAHLRIDEDTLDLQNKITQAQEIVFDYLKYPTGYDAWTSETVPAPIKSAILLVLGGLWKTRGDDEEITPDAVITPTVVSLLMRRRDPALA